MEATWMFRGVSAHEGPNPVYAQPKAWVCGSSLAQIAGSKPAGCMDVCLL